MDFFDGLIGAVGTLAVAVVGRRGGIGLFWVGRAAVDVVRAGVDCAAGGFVGAYVAFGSA